MIKRCACCHEPLDEEGDCFNGCTEDENYGVAEGAEMSEEDYALKYHECPSCHCSLPDENFEEFEIGDPNLPEKLEKIKCENCGFEIDINSVLEKGEDEDE